MDADPGRGGPGRRGHDVEAGYATKAPPWDIGRPQAALRAVTDAGGLVGRVLDVGCGTGEHALMAAGAGLDATAESFADGWRVEGIEPAAPEIRVDPGSVRAWHATVRRT